MPGNRMPTISESLLKQPWQRMLLVVSPLLLGCILLLTAWQWQAEQVRSLNAWQRRATTCAVLAKSIRELRTQPKLVESRVVDSHTLTGRLEHAAKKVGITQTQIRSIRPEYPRRLKETPYVETVTRVRLTGVPMADIVKAIWHLQKEMPGLAIPELRIWMETAEQRK